MKYPIGIQDFRKLREGGYVYVDKTEQIHQILRSGNYYFLSRPRRFGKSLLLSTMKELYSGSRELFEGLWVEEHWDWGQANPVIWLKFSSQGVKTMGLVPAIGKMLGETAHSLGFSLKETQYDLRFKELIQKAAKSSKAVLLIDEYDKPIIDYMDDVEQAEANREVLKNFYSVLKDSDPYLELVFITGVSAFSKVSIFSDLNNLKNLSLHKDASELLGITSNELETYFDSTIRQIAERQKVEAEVLFEKVKGWYNGYSWDGINKLYNPFSLLNFLDGEKFHNFWFATGTPTFLVKEMRKQRYYDIDRVEVSESQLSAFDFQNLDPITVLFQTGYLTIDFYDERFRTYRLRYPNEEVRFSLQQYLLNAYRDTLSGNALAPAVAITKALEAKDIGRVIEAINTTFSSIPYDLWQRENEHFYHALIHLMFSLLGTYIQSEVHTSKGRCDAVVQTADHIYGFEFKLDKTAGEALQQIKDKGYLAPYLDSPKQKIAVGINFSTKEKRVVEWLVEEG
ncbi:MAG: ATP-binding protein [Lewinellaceae bacterium]|nr:ATP-binding protein [Phaeodactylibacter sp.]MCB9036305.1 ATP-binding protein [Lewinellaceae bacterium]